jgi:hypothetical protein
LDPCKKEREAAPTIGNKDAAGAAKRTGGTTPSTIALPIITFSLTPSLIHIQTGRQILTFLTIMLLRENITSARNVSTLLNSCRNRRHEIDCLNRAFN